MKLATFSAFALAVLASTTHTASAFQALKPRSVAATSPATALSVALGGDDGAPGKKSILDNLGEKAEGFGQDSLDETNTLTGEQAKLLVQVINELESFGFKGNRSAPPSSKTAAGADGSPMFAASYSSVGGVMKSEPDTAAAPGMSAELSQEIESNPPSLLQLAFRLATKELVTGKLDLEWIQLVGTVAILELVAPLTNSNNAELTSKVFDLIRSSLERALTANMGYATYPVHNEYKSVPLKSMMKMVDGVPPIEYWFSLKKTLRVVVRGLTTVVGLSLNPLSDTDTASMENYEKIFKLKGLGIANPLLPLPETAFAKWAEDSEFARQFFNGVNPIMIEAVRDVPEQLSPELVEHFVSDGTTNLDALSKANRLFYVNYEELDQMVKNPHQAYPEAYNNPTYTTDQEILDRVGKEPRYFKAPMILLQLSPNLEDLQILGIQLDRSPGSKVYTALNSDNDEWQFAKTTVATADSQYHEWVSHLGKTHLTMEPHIVAIHNTLRRTNHPVYNFVKPMCRDTLLLNYAARFTLADFGPNSFGDYMTSVGTGQFMQLILKYWEKYDFFKSCAVDEELASRGFDGNVDMPAYRYKTDSMKIWNAYGTFAKNFVDEIYKTDGDVSADSDLQAWAIETSNPNRAAVKGFPEEFKTKAELARTLQTLFWICSGLHAAVNFPQYDYYAYQPNKPLGFRKSMEQRDAVGGDEAWMFKEGMPLMDKAQETVVVASTLTLPSKHCITNLDEYFADVGNTAYETFKKNLAVISNEIDVRSKEDKARGHPTYEYLKPSNIPASIDI